ncbi:hypothetical protein R2R35_19935 [Anaerocolumna sp. AGMB13020]|uniref:hypothetical protein n=1 Tax=Anaerocolumna sp. AGMB13020 TaxID=3081750 RepID=UPI00295457DA|nr:hypothetical protein [Anaerocolumna sp. AGMB13020]WOO36044.1 hypothetical protein R2R35_19935 [Anaerocolumna sp. AGMB13020]
MPFNDSSKDNQSTLLFSGQPVSVAAVFNPLGDLKPLSISITDLYSNTCKVKIDCIKYKKEIRGGFSFCCGYTIGSIQKELLLTYYVKNHMWRLED